MNELVYKQDTGFGNMLIQLTSLQKECTQLHDHVFDYEVGNCVSISGFTRVSYEGTKPYCPIYLNPYTINNVHPRIRDIIKPTPFMEDMISKYGHLVDNVSCGISIRRGSYSTDSRQFKTEQADDASHYFCSDKGLHKFINIIKNSPGSVFVSSDSKEVMNMLIETFGDKIKHYDSPYAIGMPQDLRDISMNDYHSIYLKFFLLSKCPMLYLTGGRGDMVGFSTYAYMAAIYGNKPFKIIMNN